MQLKRQQSLELERSQSGVWGGICSFFNTKNWGWETYSEDIVIYLVDIERTKKDVAKALATAFANMDKLVDTTVQADLKEQTDSFFLVLREKIEHIRGDLIASMSDQQKDQATKERLVNNLGKLERPVPNLLKDSEALVNDIKELIRKQEISNE